MKKAHKSLTLLNLIGSLALKSFHKLAIHVYMYEFYQATAHGLYG